MPKTMKTNAKVEERGITLISLVITIIVLLILASVGITSIINDDGIIKQVEVAKLASDYQTVKEALEIYKLEKELSLKYDEVTDQSLIGTIYKKVFVEDTKRELAVIVNFKEIGIKPTYGKGGEKILKDDGNDMNSTKKVDTIYELGNIYAIDLDEGSFYFINGNQIYSLEAERIEVAENEATVEKYIVETLNEQYVERRMFKTKWNVTLGETEGSSTYSTVVLPANKHHAYNATIYWGDGTSTVLKHKVDGVTLTDNQLIEKITHTYALAENDDGIRQIIISGEYTFFSMSSSTSTPTRLKLIGIEQWGDIRSNAYGFQQCTNLVGTIPEPNIDTYLENCTSFSFEKCSGLVGEIPNLFINCPKLTSTTFCFSNCSGLEGFSRDFRLPEGLTSMWAFFWNCTNLGNLPEGVTIPKGDQL